jgi:antitoxin HicB
MNRKKLTRLRREWEQMWRSPQKASTLSGLAERLGRTRVKRGKHPMWESHFDHLYVLSIPYHGQRDLPPGTRNAILDQLEADLIAWDEWLTVRGQVGLKMKEGNEAKVTALDYLKKPYARIVVPEPDGSFRAEIQEFPGCIALAPTESEALLVLQEVAAEWIDATLAKGQLIPEPTEDSGYSGKLVLRLAKSLHRKAAYAANRDGVSLNQFIVTALAEHVGAVNAVSVFNVVNFGTAAPLQIMGWSTLVSGSVHSASGPIYAGHIGTSVAGGVGTETLMHSGGNTLSALTYSSDPVSLPGRSYARS